LAESKATTVPEQGGTQSKYLTATKYLVIYASSCLLALIAFRLIGIIANEPSPGYVVLVILGLLGGYTVADFVTGTTHWFCDTFFSENTRIIGKTLIEPFRDHHLNPQSITRCRFIDQDTSSFFIIGPILFINLNAAPANGQTQIFWTAFLIGISLGLFGTNFFHRWAHQQQVARPIKWLQKSGIVLSPRRHHIHHRSYDSAYCVTSGWLNPALDAVQFYSRLERLIHGFGSSQKPKTEPEDV
jgi:Lipid desaturase domain